MAAGQGDAYQISRQIVLDDLHNGLFMDLVADGIDVICVDQVGQQIYRGFEGKIRNLLEFEDNLRQAWCRRHNILNGHAIERFCVNVRSTPGDPYLWPGSNRIECIYGDAFHYEKPINFADLQAIFVTERPDASERFISNEIHGYSIGQTIQFLKAVAAAEAAAVAEAAAEPEQEVAEVAAEPEQEVAEVAAEPGQEGEVPEAAVEPGQEGHFQGEEEEQDNLDNFTPEVSSDDD